MPTGLGDEQLWISATNDNTGTSTAFNDQSGNSNNGTPLRTTVVADTSEGGTYAFNFINASLQKIDIPTLDLTGLSNFTWSAWIYDDSPNAVNTHSTFFSWSTTTGFEDLLFYNHERSELFFQINDGVDGGNEYAQVNFQNWHHYCGTFDGSNPVATDRFKYYLDGALQTPSSTFSYPSTLGNSGTNMGAMVGTYVRNMSGIFWFNGRQDDIRAYDRTLTQAEITHLASQRGVEGPPPVGLGDEQLWLCPSINDSANDISGSGNDGTYNGGMGTVADTSNGGSRCYDFDGTNDYIDCGTNAAFTFGSGQSWSYSLWMQQSTTQGGWRGLIYHSSAGNAQGYVGLAYGSRQLSAGTGDGTTWRTNSTTFVPTVGVWTHVTVTMDRGTDLMKVYADGAEVGSFSHSYVPAPPVHSLRIGEGNPGSERFDGLIDDVRVYTRTLTQSEITHLASSRGVEGPPPVGLGDEQLWLCPSLNDSANDISGNGNNGTYQGGMGTVADTSEGGSYAFDFDGTDDYIDCGDTLEGSVGGADSAVTYSSWMKLDSYSNNNNGYGTAWMGKCDNVTNGGPLVNSVNGKIEFARFPDNSSGNDLLVSSTDVSQVPLSTWKHVAVTYSGCETIGCTSIFIDGVIVSITESEANYGSGMPDNTYHFKIGTTLYHMVFKRMMNGQLDDIRVYNRVLTQAEITHLATSRGIEGSPSTTTQYNAFITHAFKQLFQTRLR